MWEQQRNCSLGCASDGKAVGKSGEQRTGTLLCTEKGGKWEGLLWTNAPLEESKSLGGDSFLLAEWWWLLLSGAVAGQEGNLPASCWGSWESFFLPRIRRQLVSCGWELRLVAVHSERDFLYLRFPGGSEVKEPARSAGDPGPFPGSGRSPGEGNGYPLQYSSLENPWNDETGGLQSMGSQRDTGEQLTPSFSLYLFSQYIQL